jgi:hypothetical protein
MGESWLLAIWPSNDFPESVTWDRFMSVIDPALAYRPQANGDLVIAARGDHRKGRPTSRGSQQACIMRIAAKRIAVRGPSAAENDPTCRRDGAGAARRRPQSLARSRLETKRLQRQFGALGR